MVRVWFVAVVIACAIVTVTFAWKILNLLWFKPKRVEKYLRKQGFGGNSYRFLFGDVKDISEMDSEAKEKPISFTHDHMPRVIPFAHHQVSKYGRRFITWYGPVPMINVTEPELIREAFTRINDFHKQKLNPFFLLLFPGLANLEDEKWATHRRLLNPAFHLENLKLMLPAMYDGIIEIVDKWDTMTSEKGCVELDVLPYLEQLTADVISRAAFSSSYEQGRLLFELLKEQSQIVTGLYQVGALPGWKYMPTKANKRVKQLNVGIQCLLKDIIEDRKKAMDAGEAVKNDLLGILMESNFKAAAQSYKQSTPQGGRTVMSVEEIGDECKLFYFAGQETTSVLLVWTLILLSKHQDWQTRAREEILATFGNGRPHSGGLNQLKTVMMILNEVLRLYPPAPIVVRTSQKGETMLGNLSLPQGTLICLSILQVHQDPELWGDDAKEFKPERFSEGIAKATKGNLSFFPFTGGPRICIGQNFALLEAKMALAVILQRFSIEMSPSYTHAPATFINLRPQHGAHLILRRL